MLKICILNNNNNTKVVYSQPRNGFSRNWGKSHEFAKCAIERSIDTKSTTAENQKATPQPSPQWTRWNGRRVKSYQKFWIAVSLTKLLQKQWKKSKNSSRSASTSISLHKHCMKHYSGHTVSNMPMTVCRIFFSFFLFAVCHLNCFVIACYVASSGVTSAFWAIG